MPRSTTFYVGSSIQNIASTENVYRLSGSIKKGRRSRSISVYTKMPKIETIDKFTQLTAQDYYNTWKKMQEAQLPVVPMLRRITDYEVAITDLTANGSVLYDKGALWEMSPPFEVRKKQPTDSAFIEIPLLEVCEQAKKIISRATEHRIVLPPDDLMSLVVNPNGEWHLIMLDYSMIKFRSRFFGKYFTERENRKSLEYFMKIMGTLQEELRRTQD